MSQAGEGTHITPFGEARPHHRHWMRVRTDPGARQRALRGRSFLTIVAMVLLLAAALIMIAAAVYVFLGEKKVAVLPSLWTVALNVCRVVTGLFGILGMISVVAERRSGSRGGDQLSTVVSAVALIAAAVAGLGLVIVVTGLGGLGFLFAGGAVAAELFRASPSEPPLSARTGG